MASKTPERDKAAAVLAITGKKIPKSQEGLSEAEWKKINQRAEDFSRAHRKSINYMPKKNYTLDPERKK